jgi:hypothetical protein
MLDDMFPFIEPLVQPDEDMFQATVNMVEMYFDIMDKKGVDRVDSLPEGISLKGGMPLDIALSLLQPDELEKLRNYVASYLAKHPGETA